jgi:hypothetical protein
MNNQLHHKTDTPDAASSPTSDLPVSRPLKLDYWQILIGLVLSVGSIYLSFQGVQASQVFSAFSGADLGLVLLALVASVVTLLAKAVRWRLLFTQEPPALQRSFAIQTIGIFINSILPARLGDLLRAYMMGEEKSLSKMYVLGTIGVEKVFDLIFLVLSIFLLLPQVVFPTWVSKPSEYTAVLVAVLIVIGSVIAWKREGFLQLFERFSVLLPNRWRGWILRQTRNLLASLDSVRNTRQLFAILFWTLIIWILGFGTNWLVFIALNLPLSFLPAIFLLVVLQVGVAVPSSPGRIGVFHYMTVLALSVFSIAKEPALTCGIILHLVVYVPLTLIGAFYIWEEKLSWSKMMKAIALATNWGKSK